MFTISETYHSVSYLISLWPQKQKVTCSIPGGYINISLGCFIFPSGVEIENNLKAITDKFLRLGRERDQKTPVIE